MLMICPLQGKKGEAQPFPIFQQVKERFPRRSGCSPDEIDVIVETSAQASSRHLIQPQDWLVRICDPEGKWRTWIRVPALKLNCRELLNVIYCLKDDRVHRVLFITKRKQVGKECDSIP